MSKRTLHIYRKILRADVRVRFTRLHYLYIGEQEGKVLSIDLKCTIHPARVFLHECLHYFYGGMSESNVLMLERVVWKELGRKEKLGLYKKMLRREVK